MNLTKFSITMDTTHNNSSTGGYFYSETCPNGAVYAVEYTRHGTTSYTAFPSTGKVELYAGSTVRMLLSKSFSTDSWIVYPRKQAVDTTAALLGAATDYPIVCVPLSGTDLITVSLVGGTSASQAGVVNVYVEGV